MHERHPVRLAVEDDLRRSRVTVFFRLLLAIPHLLWIALWTLVLFPAGIAAWLIALVTGRLPGGLHRFFCAYVRYSTHLFAYLTLAANPYPGFDGSRPYPVDIELPDPGPLTRWKVLIRLILAVPAFLVASTLLGTAATSTSGKDTATGGGAQTTGAAVAAAVLGWFASVVTGTMPRGLRDLAALGVGYRAQVAAYVLLVTEQYPNADPTAMLASLERPPAHPVHLVGDADDLRRSRALLLFRLPLLVPLVVWLALWGILAFLASIVQWFFTLIAGRPNAALHRFLSRFVRYDFHVYAFGSLAANPFPGFTGEPGRYPLDLVLPPPGRQNRWKTLVRIVLALPAAIVEGALTGALVVDAILTWFAALFTGRAPEGLRNLSAFALRYKGQLDAYVLLLTDAYPLASPLEGGDVGHHDDDGELAAEAAA